jgi:hypothetical protein
MSETCIYKLAEQTVIIDEFKNSWCGAMYVWNQISKDYFGLDSFPSCDEKLQMEIWNAQNNKELKDEELIVLLSTLDKSIVDSDGLNTLISAFQLYGENHPNSSISAQAISLKDINLKKGEFIAWQQTSVSEFWGELDYNYEDVDNEEDAVMQYYDPNNGDIHFNIIDFFNNHKKSEI